MKKIIVPIILALILLPIVLSVGPEEVCPYGWDVIEDGKIRCLPAPEVVAEQEIAKDNLLFFDVFNIGHLLYPKAPLLGLILFFVLAFIIVKIIKFLNKNANQYIKGDK